MEKKAYLPGEYNTLVGNKESNNIKKQGLTPVVHIASEVEYWSHLRKRLDGQINGDKGIFKNASQVNPNKARADMIEGIAQIRETLNAITVWAKIDPREIDHVIDLIEINDGSLTKKIILERIDE